MSDKNLEQWVNITFCVKIGKSASGTLALLKLAYGEYAMKKSSVSGWHMEFKVEQEDVQDDLRIEELKTQTDANVEIIRTLVRSHRRLGVML
jgi:alpha-D-ribose 1-methylphosphonate 5-triphosphate synthase subunit PhnL